ncbi:MAG: aminoacetone oxidase family FAD-binding enzyme, partial [Methanocorpusculum sp.]|nr:aminoacetone oxidase family FAD-binding enzyme [Methanocorpusculum sp.]
MSEEYDVIIIGAGAAGLFCAANLKGLKVVVLEKKILPGRKLLLSGNGQCNITHAGDIKEFTKHYGANGNFVKPALMSFSNKDTITFFEDKGIKFKETEQGKIFPKSLCADDVLDTLLDICDKNGADIFYEEKVESIRKTEDGFEVRSVSTKYYSKSVVLATGGKSYPGTGSEGDGYALAEKLGHNITEVNPSLTPVYVNEFPLKDLAGISIPDADISVWREGKKVLAHKDDLLITAFGFSGPVILNSSRNIRAGDVLRINFAGLERNELDKKLVEMCAEAGGKLVRNILKDFHVP